MYAQSLQLIMINWTSFWRRLVDVARRHISASRVLRYFRILVAIAVLCLAFNLFYPEWTYHVALAGIVLFGGLVQTIDLDCGGISEINVILHICLDTLFTLASIAMLLSLGFWEMHCDIESSCKVYWWTMCLWDNLAVINGVLVYQSIRDYPKRRRVNRRSTTRIMFTRSGDPVAAVTSNSRASSRFGNPRYSLDSLYMGRNDTNESRRSISHLV